MSAIPLLRRFDIFTYKNKNGTTDTAQIPAAATVSICRQGATTTSSVPVTSGNLGPYSVPVDNVGGIQAEDAVQIGTDPGKGFTVDSIPDGAHVNLLNDLGLNLTIVSGSRLVVATGLLTIYADALATSTATNPITSDSSTGRAQAYVRNKRFDYIVSGAVSPARLFINAEGGFIPEGPCLNVLDFPTFQAAHDALPATGGAIFVPAGTYKSTSPCAFTGLVITKALALFGEANGPASALSILMHDMANAQNIDAIFVNVGGGCSIRNLFIQGPNLAGSGRGIRWYKAGPPGMAGLTLENVTVWRSPNFSFEFVCDGYDSSYVSKLDMLQCSAYEALTGGSVFLGGAGSNNNCFERCEFNGPGFGGFQNVNGCSFFSADPNHNPTWVTTTTTTFAGVGVGDQVGGMGIAYGTTVSSVETNKIVLSTAVVEDANATFGNTLTFCRTGFHTVSGCTYSSTSPTVSASSVSTIHIGDQVTGPGIVVGSKVVAVDGGANTFVLSQKPAGNGSAVTLTINTGPGADQVPRGHVHLQRTNVSRFSHCSFQGPGTSPAITTDLVSNDLALRDCYREKGTSGSEVHSFIMNGMYNLLIDGLFHQFHAQNSLLIKTGPGGLIMSRITNAQIVTYQDPLVSPNVVELNNAFDELVIDNASELSSATGEKRDLVVVGTGAVLPKAIVSTTLPPNPVTKIDLPNGSDDAFWVDGSATITKITALRPKRRVTLIFSGTAQLTDGGNLKLFGNFTGNADRTITLLCDGANWLEVCRSING